MLTTGNVCETTGDFLVAHRKYFGLEYQTLAMESRAEILHVTL